MDLSGLLGSFSLPNTQPATTGLLGQYYDPKEMQRQKRKMGLLNAGIALLSQQPRIGAPYSLGESLGTALRGGMEGAQSAQQDYMNNAQMAYQMNRQAKDDAWTNSEREYTLTKRQSESASADAQSKALEDAIKGLPLEMQTAARANPKVFMEEYTKHMMEGAYPDAPKPTTDQQNYAAAQKDPNFGVFLTNKTKDGAPVVNLNSGEPADSAIRKKLDEASGTNWGKYQAQAGVAASLAQDMQLMDELIKVAPQGPVPGRLAQWFPGVSSAGAAFQSIVKRAAPQQRAEGSGSTSDVEYNGMLQAFPSLVNDPSANGLISDMIKAKAAIDIERGNIVDEYQNGEISATFARKKLAELNKRSIMTPELKAKIFSLGPVEEGTNPDLENALKQYGD